MEEQNIKTNEDAVSNPFCFPKDYNPISLSITDTLSNEDIDIISLDMDAIRGENRKMVSDVPHSYITLVFKDEQGIERNVCFIGNDFIKVVMSGLTTLKIMAQQ